MRAYGAPVGAAGRTGAAQVVVRTGARAVLARSGRPAVTSRAELEQVALELFAARGFEATTVDDIAAAAGIGRRTFFRYYSSKNDVVWGEFEEGLSALRRHLAGAPRSQPLPDALREAVLAFNRLDPVHEPWHRDRMVLVLGVPALQAHGTLRYAAWREVVAEFVGERLALPADALLPRLVAHLCLGAALSAYEQWLREPGTDLGQLLDRCLRALDGSWALDGAWALPDGAAGGERPDPAR